MTERSPSGDGPTFWMNVTTSANWTRAPVGIVRVEQELRRHLAERLGDRFQACTFQNGTFFTESGTSASALSNEEAFWPEPYYDIAPDLFDPQNSPTPRRLTRSSVAPTKPQIQYGDVLITLGLDWDYPGLQEHIYKLKTGRNLTVVTCCYDLIPVLFPQYCVSDVAAWFTQYFIDMTWSADVVLCISENTRRDYETLAYRLGLPQRRTEVIKLGSSLPADDLQQTVSDEVAQVLGNPFFLFVSTIERRKNHEVLYRAYHLIKQANPQIKLPKLVFVGMEGWGVSELMSDIRLDPLMQGEIVILAHVTDGELVQLYQCCKAFLYPSLYEGWGLPIAEALQLGRPVIASATGSIPEVGGDLVRYVDPWSPSAWADELLRIVRGEVDLDAWSQDILRSFKACAWSVAADALYRVAGEVSECKDAPLILQPGYDLHSQNGIHYGSKIIYRGKAGIICHGPYTSLTTGSYDVGITYDLVKRIAGVMRFRLSSGKGSSELACQELEIGSLNLGLQNVRLGFRLEEETDNFEVVITVESEDEVLLSLDLVKVERQPSSLKLVRSKAAYA